MPAGRCFGLACTRAIALLLIAAPALARDSFEYKLERDERVLELRINARFGPDRQLELQQWIDQLAQSLTLVYGHWPRHRWAISISPTDAGGSDPIPWAQIHREEIDRVEFFILPNASVDELRRAWTGYHEVAHLLIPYRGWGDAWFSEGLASYYQNLLQARSGILTEDQMWQKLHDGFRRGRAESQFDGQSLHSVSEKFREDGGFMRVYWSGAWYFMAADVRLRQQSAGRLNLDLALKKLNDCCAEQSLSVAEMVRKLDELNRVFLFQPLFRELSESTVIPEHTAIFSSLGIEITDGKVRLQPKGPGAMLRKEIFHGQRQAGLTQ